MMFGPLRFVVLVSLLTASAFAERFDPQQYILELKADYQHLQVSGGSFPGSPLTKEIFSPAFPKEKADILLPHIAEWLKSRYPSFDDRPIDAQEDLSDPSGAPARNLILNWLSLKGIANHPLLLTGLTVAILSQETDEEIRKTAVDIVAPSLLRGDEMGLREKFLDMARSESMSVTDPERFLALRSLTDLVVYLPAEQKPEVIESIKQLTHRNAPIAEEAVRCLSRLLTAAAFDGFIIEVLGSGQYSSLAEAGALEAIRKRAETGQLPSNMVEALTPAAARSDQDDAIAQGIRDLLGANATAAKECSAEVSKLSFESRTSPFGPNPGVDGF